ncbi:hypothetical protein [Actinomadura gamaensis]|uniref:Lipoprotein n=1 Tax=Actinomadura gamaensis TaxID=1763541 RepID=A0ABV9TUQ9_9ACTN
MARRIGAGLRFGRAVVGAVLLAACSSGVAHSHSPSHSRDATPFTGTWRTDTTTMTVAPDGGLRFKSAVDCSGRVGRAASGGYRFAMTCGPSTMTGTAQAPASGTFTITWADGDSSQYTR